MYLSICLVIIFPCSSTSPSLVLVGKKLGAGLGWLGVGTQEPSLSSPPGAGYRLGGGRPSPSPDRTLVAHSGNGAELDQDTWPGPLQTTLHCTGTSSAGTHYFYST